MTCLCRKAARRVGAWALPPCSAASRDATLYALDPTSARRLTVRVGMSGVPERFDPPGGSNTGLRPKQGLERRGVFSRILHGPLGYSPVFDAPQAVDTPTTGRPASRRPSHRRRAQGGSRVQAKRPLTRPSTAAHTTPLKAPGITPGLSSTKASTNPAGSLPCRSPRGWSEDRKPFASLTGAALRGRGA